MHHYDHRWASFKENSDEFENIAAGGACGKESASTFAMPRRWAAAKGKVSARRGARDVELAGVADRLAAQGWDREWVCGWRDVARVTDERTAIVGFIPATAVSDKFPLMFPQVSAHLAAGLVAAQASLVFDFTSRQKVGSANMAMFMWKQLPVPTPAMLEPHLPFILLRVLELVYTAWDMEPLARDLGDEGTPFRWDEERRALLRAELDAFFFRMYGIDDPADVEYILDTFATETGGLRHHEIAKYGEYRTRRLVLDAHARMDTPTPAGIRYATPLTPPPGQGPRHPAQSKVSE